MSAVSAPDDIPLAKPEIGEREEELVLEVLRSGRLSLGPVLERFEREFAEWLGVEDTVAVSSGTAALHLGVRALGWGKGDEVVTSPFSFVASANCLLYENAAPRFVDVDPVTLNLDPEAAAAAVGEGTAGILPVDIFGYPAALPELRALAEKHGLGVLVDACEAPGAVDGDGVKVGARGHLATFAFYANKQLTTGEGGLIVPRGPGEAAELRSARNQGRAIDMDWLDHDRLGFNYRLSDLACAIGLAQLDRLDDMLAARAQVAGWYRAALAGLASERGLALPCEDFGGDRRGWFVFVVQLPLGVDRDATIMALREVGVQSKPYLPAIHLMSFYRELYGHRPGEFPIAEEVAERSVALPFFPALSESQVTRVAEALERVLT